MMKKTPDPVFEALVFFNNLPLFEGLAEKSLQKLADSCQLIHIKKGQYIFFQSDPSDKIYIVRSGMISIVLESPDGREMVINEMVAGDFFGEVGAITSKPRSTSAFSSKDSHLLAIPAPIFLEILDCEPVLTRRILMTTASRLRNSSAREGALAFLDAQARLARLMLQLEEQAPEKGYITISQEELAQRTGQTRQTVAKALGRWRRAGWVITGRGHIVLIKREEFVKLERQWSM
jgi:CRP/FNR family cyclic AMP-dependent transcriptional regulator